jgi:hypothetical protein
MIPYYMTTHLPSILLAVSPIIILYSTPQDNSITSYPNLHYARKISFQPSEQPILLSSMVLLTSLPLLSRAPFRHASSVPQLQPDPQLANEDQKADAVVKISATADGQFQEIIMPNTNCDAVISRSIILKRHADASNGKTEEVFPPEPFEDSRGHIYQPRTAIELRCTINDSAQIFSETFYVVDSCGEYDALLRKGCGSALL